MFTGCVTVSNPDSLASSEIRLKPCVRSWKKGLFERARCQKTIGGIYFTKKWRAGTLQRSLQFDNFKPPLISGIFKYISWLNDLFFGGGDRGFLKEGVKTYLMARISPALNSFFFFSFCLLILSLCPAGNCQQKKNNPRLRQLMLLMKRIMSKISISVENGSCTANAPIANQQCFL
jgi:hypothetical protein